MIYAVIGLALLFVLLVSGIWIAFAMGLSGLAALWPSLGCKTFSLIGSIMWSNYTGYTLVCLPLFVLMGDIVSTSGLTGRLFRGMSKILTGVPGGLLQVNIAAATVFAALTGSSTASAAALGRIAYPEQKSLGYSKALSLGSLAAGGTLGILIPPSIMFIIYASLANESVGRLFIAGIFPGLMVAGAFMAYIAIRATLNPSLVPASSHAQASFKVRLSGVREIWPFFLLVVSVLGAIYSGIATATESAAVGAFGALVLCLVYRTLTWRVLWQSLLNVVRLTSMIFLALIGAKLLSMVLAYYGVSPWLGEWAQSTFHTYTSLVAFIFVLYLILGCFFDVTSIVFLTFPFILPMALAYKVDTVWLGVMIVLLVEMGLMTPPIGMHLFVLQNISGESLWSIGRGAMGFVIIEAVVVWILYFFPQIALWLPSAMKGT
jgi:C4-dicarboxylate transporter DctM subunit